MKNSIFFLITSLLVFNLNAQEDYLAPLGFNTNLYYQTLEFQNTAQKDFIDNNVVITSDSISLPFIDDFSSNTLKPFNFDVNITTSIQYATGTCITNEFQADSLGFHTTQAYYYFYDTLIDKVDSLAVAPISVYEYSDATCFPNETSITSYWKSYYRSTSINFDTITGKKLDSTLVEPDLKLYIAEIYFANMPSGVNWMDNFAWWNTTNPKDPITIGVATLDGLNEFGLPYNNTVVNAYGKADKLTSKPIDLSLLGLSDDVYLSFFYQAGGIGDNPNPADSLVVEFKGQDDVWKRKWSVQGTASSDFKQVYIPIYETSFDSLLFSNTEFQFRIRNYASLSGNNDWWNIDYVRLDKNRIPASLDSVIRDVSFLYDFPNYLKNYSLVPWKQIQAGADEFIDTINIPVRDNGQVEGLVAGNFPLDINITNTETVDIIYSEIGSSFNTILGQETKNHEVLPNTNFLMPSIANSDSIHFNATMSLGASNRNLLLGNDTIKSDILFHNILAYDDGSAERAYGVSGGGAQVKKFAYEFNIATQDTLAAIQIHFSNIDENVENLVFSLFAWDSIELASDYGNIIGSIDNKKANYIDHHNGFATFVFDTPIIVNDKFYIGWAQIDNRNLQVGFDLNSTKGREHMYIFVSNAWQASTVNMQGSPMVRAILDGDYPIPPINTAINNFVKQEFIKVFPNPAYDILNFELPESIQKFEIVIYDYSGRVIIEKENKTAIDVSSLNNGIYFLKIKDKLKESVYTSKFNKK